MSIKIIILVLSHNVGIYNEFYKTQNNTWDSINHENIETFYYFGNSPENKIEGKNIFTTASESYNNCTPKTIEAFKLLQNKKFDVLFRTNSSSYIDKNLLYNFVLNKIHDIKYMGTSGEYNNIQFVSGSGYFISRKVFDLILEKSNQINQQYIDDVALAKLLYEYNIYPQQLQSERFQVEEDPNSKTPMNYFHYRFSDHHVNNNIERMKELHNFKCTI